MLKAGGDGPLGLLLDEIAIRANCPKRKGTPDIYDKCGIIYPELVTADEGSRGLSEMTRRTFAIELETAADQIADVSPRRPPDTTPAGRPASPERAKPEARC